MWRHKRTPSVKETVRKMRVPQLISSRIMSMMTIFLMCRFSKISITSISLRCHPIARPPLSTPSDSLKCAGALWTVLMMILSTLKIKTSLDRFEREVMHMHQIKALMSTIKASLKPSQVKPDQNFKPRMKSVFEGRLKLEKERALRSMNAKKIMLQRFNIVIAKVALSKV